MWVSAAVGIMCAICFCVDISVNPIKNTTLASESAQELDFEAMVNEYDTNEVRAKEIYKGNRYVITAQVTDIEQAGFSDGYSGYNVDMVVALTNGNFSISGNFQGDLKDDIMELNIGDILTFTGKCETPRLWQNCTIVEVN